MTGNPRATLGSHTVLGQTRPLIELMCPLCSPTFGSCRMDSKSSKTAWDRSDTTGMHARHHSMLGQTRPLFALMCQCCSLSCVVLETGCEGRTTHMHVLRHGAHACRWFGRLRSNMTAVCADVSALSSDLRNAGDELQGFYNPYACAATRCACVHAAGQSSVKHDRCLRRRLGAVLRLSGHVGWIATALQPCATAQMRPVTRAPHWVAIQMVKHDR